jgi:hypothetical protein
MILRILQSHKVSGHKKGIFYLLKWVKLSADPFAHTAKPLGTWPEKGPNQCLKCLKQVLMHLSKPPGLPGT